MKIVEQTCAGRGRYSLLGYVGKPFWVFTFMETIWWSGLCHMYNPLGSIAGTGIGPIQGGQKK